MIHCSCVPPVSLCTEAITQKTTSKLFSNTSSMYHTFRINSIKMFNELDVFTLKDEVVDLL